MNQEKPYICKALGIKMVVLPRNGNNVLNLNTMKIKHLFLSILLMGVVSMTAQEEARMLRFPTIHGNNVVFSYGGDLYSVDIKGGIAHKITNDANGYEMFRPMANIWLSRDNMTETLRFTLCLIPSVAHPRV